MVELHIHAFMPPGGEPESQLPRNPFAVNQNNRAATERPAQVIQANPFNINNRPNLLSRENLFDQMAQTEQEDEQIMSRTRFEEKAVQTDRRSRRDRQLRNRGRLDSELSYASQESSSLQINQQDDSIPITAKKEIEIDKIGFS